MVCNFLMKGGGPPQSVTVTTGGLCTPPPSCFACWVTEKFILWAVDANYFSCSHINTYDSYFNECNIFNDLITDLYTIYISWTLKVRQLTLWISSFTWLKISHTQKQFFCLYFRDWISESVILYRLFSVGGLSENEDITHFCAPIRI